MRPMHLQFDCCRIRTVEGELSANMAEFEMKQTYQGAKIVPDLGDVWVQANSPGVCIKCVAVLVDLVIKYADRTPECRIAPVSVDCLLIGFVRLGVLLLRHVTPA